MPQDTTKPNQSEVSVPPACIPTTSSRPMDIRPKEIPTKLQHWSFQTSVYGSGPPKSFSFPKSSTYSSALSASRSSIFPSSSNSSTTGVKNSSTTWDDPKRCAFIISDADLYSSDGDTGMAPILEEAPSKPKPQLPIMPLLKGKKVDRSRQVHCKIQSATMTLSDIKENLEEEEEEEEEEE